jgi:hypothetical protein
MGVSSARLCGEGGVLPPGTEYQLELPEAAGCPEELPQLGNWGSGHWIRSPSLTLRGAIQCHPCSKGRGLTPSGCRTASPRIFVGEKNKLGWLGIH